MSLLNLTYSTLCEHQIRKGMVIMDRVGGGELLGLFYMSNFGRVECNTRFPLLRFRSALHCGYSGITDIQDGLFLS